VFWSKEKHESKACEDKAFKGANKNEAAKPYAH